MGECSALPFFAPCLMTHQWLDAMVVVIIAGIIQATMTAASMASIASFVAFPAMSPFTICSILFLRCLISLFPKMTGRISIQLLITFVLFKE
jgi:hypothetical protein